MHKESPSSSSSNSRSQPASLAPSGPQRRPNLRRRRTSVNSGDDDLLQLDPLDSIGTAETRTSFSHYRGRRNYTRSSDEHETKIMEKDLMLRKAELLVLTREDDIKALKMRHKQEVFELERQIEARETEVREQCRQRVEGLQLEHESEVLTLQRQLRDARKETEVAKTVLAATNDRNVTLVEKIKELVDEKMARMRNLTHKAVQVDEGSRVELNLDQIMLNLVESNQKRWRKHIRESQERVATPKSLPQPMSVEDATSVLLGKYHGSISTKVDDTPREAKSIVAFPSLADDSSGKAKASSVKRSVPVRRESICYRQNMRNRVERRLRASSPSKIPRKDRNAPDDDSSTRGSSSSKIERMSLRSHTTAKRESSDKNPSTPPWNEKSPGKLIENITKMLKEVESSTDMKKNAGNLNEAGSGSNSTEECQYRVKKERILINLDELLPKSSDVVSLSENLIKNESDVWESDANRDDSGTNLLQNHKCDESSSKNTAFDIKNDDILDKIDQTMTNSILTMKNTHNYTENSKDTAIVRQGDNTQLYTRRNQIKTPQFLDDSHQDSQHQSKSITNAQSNEVPSKCSQLTKRHDEQAKNHKQSTHSQTTTANSPSDASPFPQVAIKHESPTIKTEIEPDIVAGGSKATERAPSEAQLSRNYRRPQAAAGESPLTVNKLIAQREAMTELKIESVEPQLTSGKADSGPNDALDSNDDKSEQKRHNSLDEEDWDNFEVPVKPKSGKSAATSRPQSKAADEMRTKSTSVERKPLIAVKSDIDLMAELRTSSSRGRSSQNVTSTESSPRKSTTPQHHRQRSLDSPHNRRTTRRDSKVSPNDRRSTSNEHHSSRRSSYDYSRREKSPVDYIAPLNDDKTTSRSFRRSSSRQRSEHRSKSPYTPRRSLSSDRRRSRRSTSANRSLSPFNRHERRRHSPGERYSRRTFNHNNYDRHRELSPMYGGRLWRERQQQRLQNRHNQHPRPREFRRNYSHEDVEHREKLKQFERTPSVENKGEDTTYQKVQSYKFEEIWQSNPFEAGCIDLEKQAEQVGEIAESIVESTSSGRRVHSESIDDYLEILERDLKHSDESEKRSKYHENAGKHRKNFEKHREYFEKYRVGAGKHQENIEKRQESIEKHQEDIEKHQENNEKHYENNGKHQENIENSEKYQTSPSDYQTVDRYEETFAQMLTHTNPLINIVSTLPAQAKTSEDLRKISYKNARRSLNIDGKKSEDYTIVECIESPDEVPSKFLKISEKDPRLNRNLSRNDDVMAAGDLGEKHSILSELEARPVKRIRLDSIGSSSDRSSLSIPITPCYQNERNCEPERRASVSSNASSSAVAKKTVSTNYEAKILNLGSENVIMKMDEEILKFCRENSTGEDSQAIASIPAYIGDSQETLERRENIPLVLEFEAEREIVTRTDRSDNFNLESTGNVEPDGKLKPKSAIQIISVVSFSPGERVNETFGENVTKIDENFDKKVQEMTDFNENIDRNLTILSETAQKPIFIDPKVHTPSVIDTSIRKFIEKVQNSANISANLLCSVEENLMDYGENLDTLSDYDRLLQSCAQLRENSTKVIEEVQKSSQLVESSRKDTESCSSYENLPILKVANEESSKLEEKSVRFDERNSESYKQLTNFSENAVNYKLTAVDCGLELEENVNNDKKFVNYSQNKQLASSPAQELQENVNNDKKLVVYSKSTQKATNYPQEPQDSSNYQESTQTYQNLSQNSPNSQENQTSFDRNQTNIEESHPKSFEFVAINTLEPEDQSNEKIDEVLRNLETSSGGTVDCLRVVGYEIGQSGNAWEASSNNDVEDTEFCGKDILGTEMSEDDKKFSEIDRKFNEIVGKQSQNERSFESVENYSENIDRNYVNIDKCEATSNKVENTSNSLNCIANSTEFDTPAITLSKSDANSPNIDTPKTNQPKTDTNPTENDNNQSKTNADETKPIEDPTRPHSSPTDTNSKEDKRPALSHAISNLLNDPQSPKNPHLEDFPPEFFAKSPTEATAAKPSEEPETICEIEREIRSIIGSDSHDLVSFKASDDGEVANDSDTALNDLIEDLPLKVRKVRRTAKKAPSPRRSSKRQQKKATAERPAYNLRLKPRIIQQAMRLEDNSIFSDISSEETPLCVDTVEKLKDEEPVTKPAPSLDACRNFESSFQQYIDTISNQRAVGKQVVKKAILSKIYRARDDAPSRARARRRATVDARPKSDEFYGNRLIDTIKSTCKRLRTESGESALQQYPATPVVTQAEMSTAQSLLQLASSPSFLRFDAIPRCAQPDVSVKPIKKRRQSMYDPSMSKKTSALFQREPSLLKYLGIDAAQPPAAVESPQKAFTSMKESLLRRHLEDESNKATPVSESVSVIVAPQTQKPAESNQLPAMNISSLVPSLKVNYQQLSQPVSVIQSVERVVRAESCESVSVIVSSPPRSYGGSLITSDQLSGVEVALPEPIDITPSPPPPFIIEDRPRYEARRAIRHEISRIVTSELNVFYDMKKFESERPKELFKAMARVLTGHFNDGDPDRMPSKNEIKNYIFEIFYNKDVIRTSEDFLLCE